MHGIIDLLDKFRGAALDVILPIIVAWISTQIVRLLAQHRKSKWLTAILQIADNVVRDLEQERKGNTLPARGSADRNVINAKTESAAVDRIIAQCREAGIAVPGLDHIITVIRAAVNRLHPPAK